MSKTTQHSREDYLAGECTHREYYAQFVTPSKRKFVAATIGIDRIVASTDPHFNDIPLGEWDRIYMGAAELSSNVCIAKEAARQLQEQ